LSAGTFSGDTVQFVCEYHWVKVKVKVTGAKSMKCVSATLRLKWERDCKCLSVCVHVVFLPLKGNLLTVWSPQAPVQQYLGVPTIRRCGSKGYSLVMYC